MRLIASCTFCSTAGQVGAIGEGRGDPGSPRIRGRGRGSSPATPGSPPRSAWRRPPRPRRGSRRGTGDDHELRQRDRREQLLLEGRERDLPKMPTTIVSRAISARLRRLKTDSRCTELLGGESGRHPLCTVPVSQAAPAAPYSVGMKGRPLDPPAAVSSPTGIGVRETSDQAAASASTQRSVSAGWLNGIRMNARTHRRCRIAARRRSPARGAGRQGQLRADRCARRRPRW